MSHSDFVIYVFSHNRAETLDLALASCLRNFVQAKVYLVDDSSDCPKTHKVIRKWDSFIDMLDVSSRSALAQRQGQGRGGLHANMQAAIEHADAVGYRYALFLQDDMQIVRPIQERDEADVREYFAANEAAQSLHVAFSPFHSEPGPMEWEWDLSRTALVPGREARQTLVFSDIDLFDVRRFLAFSGRFELTEAENVRRASERSLLRGVFFSPFVMFLPYPKTCGNRKTSSTKGRLACRFAEKLTKSGVHPFLDMDEPTVAVMRSRSRVSPARAREWLTCPTVQNRPLWSYYGGLRDLRAHGGLGALVAIRLGAREPQS